MEKLDKAIETNNLSNEDWEEFCKWGVLTMDQYEKRAAAQIEHDTAILVNLMRNNKWYELHIGLRNGEVEVQVLEAYYSPRPYVAAKFDQPADAF
jgi:hypothetical protein